MNTFAQRRIGATPINNNKREVMNFILSPELFQMRRGVCHGCRYTKLFDKNGKSYNIDTLGSLENAKQIVEQIKKVNDESN